MKNSPVSLRGYFIVSTNLPSKILPYFEIHTQVLPQNSALMYDLFFILCKIPFNTNELTINA